MVQTKAIFHPVNGFTIVESCDGLSWHPDDGVTPVITLCSRWGKLRIETYIDGSDPGRRGSNLISLNEMIRQQNSYQSTAEFIYASVDALPVQEVESLHSKPPWPQKNTPKFPRFVLRDLSMKAEEAVAVLVLKP